ncbi:hypothetical protein SAMN04490182_1621 [Pseudomonas cedrina]|uniref:Uncharacterized protein n=2 Tax=Pseudomonas cedrina TaxID=651740 RepID=A0A1V2K6Y4_PSECE|nr:hypothetical protein [Pseudomonas cedrina]ONH53244.1 hypothetical protein BLL36_16315 [Pseudomonas cedrina subsp. cedrina]SDS47271.1 hypothetical protein SAMN04490182_1621 [Pseudomonas cedrina]
MSYLEEEIDEALNTLNINHNKIHSEDLKKLIKKITEKFFRSESQILDPVNLIEKATEHNPNFWKEIPERIKKTDLMLLVFDTAYRAWELRDSQELASVIGETTGYPFWVTDQNLTFLVHLDDHDCVLWAY